MRRYLPFLGVCVLAVIQPSAASGQATQFLWQWSVTGGQGLAVGANGYVYVGSREQILVYTPEGGLITQWGEPEQLGTVQFSPVAIATDQSGRVLVGDYYNNRVIVFSQSGAYLTQWPNRVTYQPRGIATDRDGYVYLATYVGIQKFTSSGAFVTSWGSPGTGPGEFDRLYGIAVDNDGYVYAADQNNHRIQKFTSTGSFVREWGSFGYDPGQLNYPTFVAVDAQGFVYVSEYLGPYVSVWTKDGAYVTRLGSVGNGPGQIEHPWTVTVDATNRLFVEDGARIEVFGQAAPTVASRSSWGQVKALYR